MLSDNTISPTCRRQIGMIQARDAHRSLNKDKHVQQSNKSRIVMYVNQSSEKVMAKRPPHV